MQTKLCAPKSHPSPKSTSHFVHSLSSYICSPEQLHLQQINFSSQLQEQYWHLPGISRSAARFLPQSTAGHAHQCSPPSCPGLAGPTLGVGHVSSHELCQVASGTSNGRSWPIAWYLSQDCLSTAAVNNHTRLYIMKKNVPEREYMNISHKQDFARFKYHPDYHAAFDFLQSFEMQNSYTYILTGNNICIYLYVFLMYFNVFVFLTAKTSESEFVNQHASAIFKLNRSDLLALIPSFFSFHVYRERQISFERKKARRKGNRLALQHYVSKCHRITGWHLMNSFTEKPVVLSEFCH